MDIEVFAQSANALGEGPRWVGSRSELHWVDIHRGEIHTMAVGGTHRVVRLGQTVGAVVPRRDGAGWIAGLRDGVALLDSGGVIERVVAVDDRPSHRMNDGVCDAAGRLWIGTLDEDHAGHTDRVYVVSHDLVVRVAVDDVGLSNGIGWSPDGQTMYRVDSARGAIYACTFDPGSGERGGEEVLAEIPSHEGEPDGLTVDAEGFVWVAVWDGWELRRYAPDGAVDRVVAVPVARPTSCVFGGADLSTLYVTSARTGLSAADLLAQPWAGHVLACAPGIAGMPTNLFGA